jgi:phage shock protein PspC (stress-responsive transcriptional regulator)
MHSVRTSLLARDDTFFGVCEALGEDFGFNGQYLRAAFAVAIFFNPLGAIGAYAGLGLLVAVTRWIAPDPKPAAGAPAAAPARAEAGEGAAVEIVGAVVADEDEGEAGREVPLAA